MLTYSIVCNPVIYHILQVHFLKRTLRCFSSPSSEDDHYDSVSAALTALRRGGGDAGGGNTVLQLVTVEREGAKLMHDQVRSPF